MVTYEAMTPQCGRSVVEVLVVRVDIGVVIYEAMTPQCGRLVVHNLVVKEDIGGVTYDAILIFKRTIDFSYNKLLNNRSMVEVLVVRCD